MWNKIKRDIVERFLNFETAKGIYLVPAGLLIIYVTIFYIQFILQAVFITGGVYMISEGLRKVFVNRIKQSVAKDKLVEARKAANVG